MHKDNKHILKLVWEKVHMEWQIVFDP